MNSSKRPVYWLVISAKGPPRTEKKGPEAPVLLLLIKNPEKGDNLMLWHVFFFSLSDF